MKFQNGEPFFARHSVSQTCLNIRANQCSLFQREEQKLCIFMYARKIDRASVVQYTFFNFVSYQLSVDLFSRYVRSIESKVKNMLNQKLDAIISYHLQI